MTGHLLGGAGGLEAGVTVLALRDQILPPTINLENQDPETDNMDFVPNQARKADFEYAMSNSFGFGGTNGALLPSLESISKFQRSDCRGQRVDCTSEPLAVRTDVTKIETESFASRKRSRNFFARKMFPS